MSVDRDALRARLVPAGYAPRLHLAFTSIVGLGLIAAAALLIRHLRGWELATVPVVFVISNMTEWRAHRDILHKRIPLGPLAVLYDRHTPEHHVIFVTDDMEMRSTREFRLVLIPAYGIVVIFLGVLPVAVAGWFLERNVALLYVITAMGYVVSYEWLHLAYHLPRTSLVGGSPIIRALRRHHATHHDPRLMQRWNFNVTLPLWDWVRGTIYSGDRAEK